MVLMALSHRSIMISVMVFLWGLCAVEFLDELLSYWLAAALWLCEIGEDTHDRYRLRTG